MSLAGDLKEISFSELLQLCAKIKRSGVLAIRRSEGDRPAGLFYFENGELLDASLDDARGSEAVYAALEIRAGTFRFSVDTPSVERSIHVSVSALLVEGMRRIDDRLPAPPGEEPVELVAAPTGPLPAMDSGETRSIDRGDDRVPEPESVALEDAEIMELTMRTCPTCARSFIQGATCPYDGAVLVVGEEEERGVTLEVPKVSLTATAPARRARPWGILAALGAAGTAALIFIPFSHQKISSPQIAAETITVPAPVPINAAPAAPPAATPAAPAVQGVSDKEIVFGMAGPLSGPARELGRQMKLGMEAAFTAINDSGGINGRQLRLVAIDDGYEPTRTLEAMKALYEQQRVFAIAGNVGTPTAAVALPFALERKMVFFGAFTGAGLLRHDPPDRYVFNVRASYAEETAAVVRYLLRVRHLRPDQIAVFAQQDSFGDAGYSGVARALRTLGVDAPSLRVGYKRNTVDVADAVQKLRNRRKGLRAVVMVATYRAAAKFIEQMHDVSDNLIFTNVSFVGSTALADELRLVNPRLASGVIVTQVVPPVDSYSTAILKYKAALAHHAPGENPDYVSLEGYLDANLLAEGLRRAGRDLDGEKLVEALESVRGYDLGVGTPIAYGAADHQALHKVWGTVLDDHGRYQALDLE